MEKFLARQCKIHFLCLTELSGWDTPAATENQLATRNVILHPWPLPGGHFFGPHLSGGVV
jgi:hypothetical protein